MIDFYNAFISYRHAPLDMKIAEHVQRKLEHFHVPHNLRKKLKHKKITRIFRDKDELPITSNLSETITDALEKAEYLIVICSTNTKESEWVRREIKTFLKTHTRDKILTVLCDGEPYDVIPEEILFQEQEVTDENGVSHTVQVPLEPLSCDYRLPMKAADREELPRLASALLGCSYDELQRRRRQYRIRRAAAVLGIVFAALATFGLYMVRSNRLINQNLIKSLESKSVYLSSESERLFSEGKRLDALQIALQALPKNSKDKMPVTAQAMRAITESTYAYKTSKGAAFDAIWNFKSKGIIQQFLLSPENGYLATLDNLGYITCMDTNERKTIFELSGEGEAVKIIFTGEKRLLVIYRDKLVSYSTSDGEAKWTYDMYSPMFDDGEVVLSDGKLYFEGEPGILTILSAKDGSQLESRDINKTTFAMFSMRNLAVSEDGRKIAYTDSADPISFDNICIYDLDKDELFKQSVDAVDVSGLFFADNEHLMLVSPTDLFSSSTQMGNYTFVGTTFMLFRCFDTSLNELWSNEFSYEDISTSRDYMILPSRNAVVYYIGNTAMVYDIDTGETLHTYKAGSSIVDLSDNDGDGMPMMITRDGRVVYSMNQDNNALAFIEALKTNISQASVGGGIYTVTDNGTDVIFYNIYNQDDEWVPLSDDEDFSTGSTFQFWDHDDKHLAIISYDPDESRMKLTVVDLESGELDFQTFIEGESMMFNSDVYVMDDKIIVLNSPNVYEIDLKTEEVEKKDLTIGTRTLIEDDRIFDCTIDIDGNLIVNVTDLKNYKTKEFKNKNIDGFISGTPSYLKALNALVVPVDEDIYVLDLDKGSFKFIEMPENIYFNGAYVITDEKGSKILLSNERYVVVYDSSWKELYNMSFGELELNGAIFRDGTLYITTEDYLMTYDADTGEYESRYEISSLDYSGTTITFDEEDNLIYIQSYDQLDIVDIETMYEITRVDNVYLYDFNAERFYTYSYKISECCSPGYFERYTLEQLIEKAKQILNGEPIAQEYIVKYGL
ncbi:MAG: TIR domain-containing protein [Clostridia bacterium]|nr:TIR domain-containing protein [Clostridia bacterium]